MTVGRVSQIENGELPGVGVLDRYVIALGGILEIVANFGANSSRSTEHRRYGKQRCHDRKTARVEFGFYAAPHHPVQR